MRQPPYVRRQTLSICAAISSDKYCAAIIIIGYRESEVYGFNKMSVGLFNTVLSVSFVL